MQTKPADTGTWPFLTATGKQKNEGQPPLLLLNCADPEVMGDRPSFSMEVGESHLPGKRDQRAQGIAVGAVEFRAIEQ